MTDLPDKGRFCKATTKAGHQCSHWALRGSDLCAMHGGKAGPKNSSAPMKTEGDLREILAERYHRLWSTWMENLFRKTIPVGDDCEEIPALEVYRWQRHMKTPYADLSEPEKEIARTQADGFIAAIYQHLTSGGVIRFGPTDLFLDTKPQKVTIGTNMETRMIRVRVNDEEVHAGERIDAADLARILRAVGSEPTEDIR